MRVCGFKNDINNTKTMSYDTIVIGLGSAGCTAASTLAQAGRRVLALEAQGRVGGRVHTVTFGDGVVEVGAEWMHGTQGSRVHDTAIQNNVDVMNQTLDFELFMSDGTPGDKKLVGELIDFALEVVDDQPPVPEPLGQYISRRVISYIKEKHPHVSNDTEFIHSFLSFMDLVIDNVEGSNSWDDVTTHSRYQELPGHQYASWHRHGYKTFFEILLNTYKNRPGYPSLEVLLNKEVSTVRWAQDPTQLVSVSCADGTVYSARNVIVTVSLGVLKERHKNLFYPNLPDDKVKIIENMSMGIVEKIIMFFDKVWWPSNASFFGFMWETEARLKIHPNDAWITRIYACTCPINGRNALTVWTSGKSAVLVESLPDDVVKTKVMELLRRFMGRNITIPEPTGMLRSSWHSNPFTRGSYSYDNLLTPQNPDCRAELGRPLVDSAGEPRVMFAGEATNPIHFSTVHGAAETGYREAMRLLAVPSKI